MHVGPGPDHWPLVSQVTLLFPVNTNPTSHTYDTTAPKVVEDTVDKSPPLVGMGGSPQSMTGGKERQRGNRTV